MPAIDISAAYRRRGTLADGREAHGYLDPEQPWIAAAAGAQAGDREVLARARDGALEVIADLRGLVRVLDAVLGTHRTLN